MDNPRPSAAYRM